MTINLKAASKEIAKRVRDNLLQQPIDVLMANQAKRRIRNSGDSEVSYPPLWADSFPGHYRAGGKPLWDRGFLINGLSGKRAPKGVDGVTYTVTTTHPGNDLVGVYQQAGFSTKGPNFIPLTLKASRIHLTGNDPFTEGLIPGIDFIVITKGVTIPPRPISRTAPEDLAEIRVEIAEAVAAA